MFDRTMSVRDIRRVARPGQPDGVRLHLVSRDGAVHAHVWLPPDELLLDTDHGYRLVLEPLPPLADPGDESGIRSLRLLFDTQENL
jgi:hypothetical protein